MGGSQPGLLDQIVLFGDSITEQSASQERGFAFMPALQDSYLRQLDVINRGFSGYNTAHAIKILPAFMPTPEQARIRLLTVFFGANDACLPGSESGQHVPLYQYKQNLRNIVEHAAVRGQKPRIVLITPPPVDEYALAEHGLCTGTAKLQRTAEHTKKYAEACRETGEDLDVVVLDLWLAFMERAGYTPGKTLPGDMALPRNEKLKEYLRDGLHLSPAGYKVMFECFMDRIQQAWPDQTPQALPLNSPQWREASK